MKVIHYQMELKLIIIIPCFAKIIPLFLKNTNGIVADPG
jgi:hypothetical protein